MIYSFFNEIPKHHRKKLKKIVVEYGYKTGIFTNWMLYNKYAKLADAEKAIISLTEKDTKTYRAYGIKKEYRLKP